MWAHNFTSDAEVSQHLMGSSDPQSYWGPPTRVVDETGMGCLQQIALGAMLSAPFAAGSTTMLIDDATYWPDPAATGPFYFQACKQAPNVGGKNLFRCTARSGTTLTVQYVSNAGNSAYAGTPQSYVAGDYVGQEQSREWRRVFAALPAGENGLATDDPGANGSVPLRSRLNGNSRSVPHDLSLWQYGFYGHPSVQVTWQNWTPWVGSTTYTPRGVAQGTAAKYRLWDGDEFWIQFRIKIDRRFWTKHSQPDPNGETSYWGRKLWALQSEVSSVNQLVTGIGPSNRYSIPTTNPNPFELLTYKAARVIGDSDYARTRSSLQPGSPWDVAPYHADTSSSFRPSTGCPTPDGSAAWEWKDGEWITFLVHVRPGRSGVHETQIDVSFARTEDPAYRGTYTTLLSVTDANIVYSGHGDYDYPDGPFTNSAVAIMDALPGFQAFGLMGYFNIHQNADIPPPKASYYVRMAQVIFSQAIIPPPAS